MFNERQVQMARFRPSSVGRTEREWRSQNPGERDGIAPNDEDLLYMGILIVGSLEYVLNTLEYMKHLELYIYISLIFGSIVSITVYT